MPIRSNDQVIQRAREVRRKQIETCSQRAARKIISQLKAVSEPTAEKLAELIADEFTELNP
jgi:hypothetical protein